MGKNYRSVRDFPSKSNPSKSYTVSIDEDGELSCTCPAWTFKKGSQRTCRHVQEVEGSGESPSPAPMPVPQVAAREKGGSLADLLARIDKE